MAAIEEDHGLSGRIAPYKPLHWPCLLVLRILICRIKNLIFLSKIVFSYQNRDFSIKNQKFAIKNCILIDYDR